MESLMLRTLGRDEQKSPLFHYTDAAGFLGILRSGQIWATHSRYLNDRDELVIGERVVESEARALLDVVRDLPWQVWLLESFIKTHESQRLTEVAEIFVASFSEKADSLSQWRGYAGNGAGFAIGFEQLPVPDTKEVDVQVGPTLFKVIYDEAEFRALARSELLEVVQSAQSFIEEFAMSDADVSSAANRALQTALQRIAALVPRLKNAAFEEECEWRLIVAPMHGREREVVQFRARASGIVPYIPVKFGADSKPLPLARVVVGPVQDEAQGLHGARMLMKHLGYPEGLVSRSAAPYRG